MCCLRRGLCDAVCLSLASQAQLHLLLTFKICMNPRCDHLICVCCMGGTLLSVPSSPWVQQLDPPFFTPCAVAWLHTQGLGALPTGPRVLWGPEHMRRSVRTQCCPRGRQLCSVDGAAGGLVPTAECSGLGPACQPTPPSRGIEQVAQKNGHSVKAMRTSSLCLRLCFHEDRRGQGQSCCPPSVKNT